MPKLYDGPKVKKQVVRKPIHKVPEQAERGGKPESTAVKDFKKQQSKTLTQQKKKKLPEMKTVKREVIYPSPGVTLYKEGGKYSPITAAQAKEMLGWLEYDAEGYSKEVKSLLGDKVILSNNMNNRPLYGSVVQLLKQEHLRKRWRLNGEPIIIGKTGLILNGQHTLLSLILAVKTWEENPEEYPAWESEPVMEKVVVVGVEEDDEIVNTLDTCKPRSLTDVIFRSRYFEGMKNSDRKKCAKICEYAVRMLWDRTGIGQAFELRRTHSESLDFIEKHQKMLECVKYVYEEDGDGEESGKISRFIHCGFAAALMYLMGSSLSDGKSYHELDTRSETDLDWENWEKACDFWVDFAGNSVKVAGVKKCYADLVSVRGSLTMGEKMALFAKAWKTYVEKNTVKVLTLKYTENDEGVSCLGEHPVVGGIDLGSPEDVSELAKSKSVPEIPEETEAQEEKPKSSKVKPKKGEIQVGEEVWVKEDTGEPWQGILKETGEGSDGKTALVTALKPYAGAGKSFEVRFSFLRREQPE